MSLAAVRETRAAAGILDAFHDLGASIQGRWARVGERDAELTAIALDALSAFCARRRVVAGEVIDAVLRAPDLQRQAIPKATFSDAPVTVYAGERFFIDVLFWVDSTTNIHGHAFHGAFAVLEGQSLHSSYTFAPHDATAPELHLGDLVCTGRELLARGDARPIDGAETIHALTHLERPTLSLVARTRAVAGARQYSYLRAGIAHESSLVPVALHKRCQVLRIAYRTARDRFWEGLTDCIRRGSPVDAALLVLGCAEYLDWSDFGEAARIAVARHPVLRGRLDRAMRDAVHETRIHECRHLAQDVRSRTLLALLSLEPDRAAALSVLGRAFPDASSDEALAAALTALAAEPAAADIGGYLSLPLSTGNAHVLAELARGRTAPQIADALAAAGDPASLDDIEVAAALARASLFAAWV